MGFPLSAAFTYLFLGRNSNSIMKARAPAISTQSTSDTQQSRWQQASPLHFSCSSTPKAPGLLSQRISPRSLYTFAIRLSHSHKPDEWNVSEDLTAAMMSKALRWGRLSGQSTGGLGGGRCSALLNPTAGKLRARPDIHSSGAAAKQVQNHLIKE